MRLGVALFVAYFLILALCFSYPIASIANSLRTRYLEGIEEPLVDQANILAAVIGKEMETGRFDPEELLGAFQGVYERRLSAAIYEMRKERVDSRVYITDGAGKVVFDSLDPENVGADYSRYRDVSLTLKGEYGARTTRKLQEEPKSAVLYVAAPIHVNGELAGVLTVAEPTTSVNTFLQSAKPRIIRIGVLSALVALSLGLLVSLWVSGQIQRLTRYARDVGEGRRVDLPRLARTELKDMGRAFDRMRESLEGKKYVEQYVQTLTHEIKSPVSAIRGAAELLEEEMPREQRSRFLSNIRAEAARIQDLIERMLKLSELETRRAPVSMDPIRLGDVILAALESRESMIETKEISVTREIEEGLVATGDRFLLLQALSNLLQNALDFSPHGGTIAVKAEADGSRITVTVEDSGPGIPDYAREKVFEKFFSLQRPDSGRKSTGLGLTFVREIASLHGGDIRLENLPGRGLRASFTLPA